MLPYVVALFVLFFCFVFDLSSKKYIQRIGLFFSYFVLVFFIGLRDETGTDWVFYADHYAQLLKGGVGYNYEFDVGYESLAKLFATVGFSYNIFVFVFTITYAAIFYVAFSYSKNPNLAAFLFFTMHLIGLMGTSRQLMALSFVVLAGQWLLVNERLKALIFILIASLFHKSALVMLVMFWVTNPSMSLTKKKMMGVILGVLVANFASEYLFDILLKFFSFSDLITSKLIDYLANDEKMPLFYVEDRSVVYLMFLKRLLILGSIFVLFLQDQENIKIQFSLKLYFIGFVLFFSLYELLPAVAVRMSIYFSIFEIFAYSNVNKKSKAAFLLSVLYLSLSVYTYIILLSGPDSDLLIPYKGIFFGQEYQRDLR